MSEEQSTERLRYSSTRTHGNMFGYRGVEWHQSRGKFAARIEPANGKRGKWLGRFETAEDAARAYDQAAREVYGTDAFLNFPQPGEKAVQKSLLRDGLCPEGHALAEFGKENNRGQMICRRCNANAANRSYRRRVSAKEAAHVN